MPSGSHTSRRRFLLGSAAAGSVLALDSARGEMLPPATFENIPAAVSLSIGNTVREGLTDIPWLPRPFEIDLLSSDRALRRSVALCAAEMVAEAKFSADRFSPLETIAIPKRNYATRRNTAVVEPMDAIVYLALALLAVRAIEGQRIPVADQIVYSYRLAPKQGRIFDSQYDIRAFLRASRQSERDGALVAACDIADFYAHLPPETIARALANAGVEPWVREYLTALLEFWTRDGSRGLPVGSNSSRILAEAVLIPVDRALQAEGIPFIRYVDDFRFFTADSKEASRALELVADVLAQEGLYLNPDKTRFWYPDGANVVAAEREKLLHRVAQAPSRGPNPRGGGQIDPSNPQGYNPQDLPIQGPQPPDSYQFGPQFPDRPRPGDPPTYPPPGYQYDPDPDTGLPLPKLPRRFAPRTRYSGLVSRYARRPSERELQQLRQAAPPDATALLEGDLAHTEGVRTAMRQAIFGGHVEFVRTIPSLLARYPEFTCYVVSALTKGSEYLPAETRHEVSRALAEVLFDPATEAFLKPKLLELVSHPAYSQRETIERFARESAGRPRGLHFRAALDALRKTGGIPSDLHALHGRTDAWGRRTLVADATARGMDVSVAATSAHDPFMAILVSGSATERA